MNQAVLRRGVLHLGIAAGAALLLPSARACEYFSANLRITHPWTRATGPGAGSAIVCMKFDDVLQDDRLIGVETPVAAGAELGGLGARPEVDFAIPAGRETLLSEAGTFVRLVGLNVPMEVARQYPMDLIFERSGRVAATLNVDYTRFR